MSIIMCQPLKTKTNKKTRRCSHQHVGFPNNQSQEHQVSGLTPKDLAPSQIKHDPNVFRNRGSPALHSMCPHRHSFARRQLVQKRRSRIRFALQHWSLRHYGLPSSMRHRFACERIRGVRDNAAARGHRKGVRVLSASSNRGSDSAFSSASRELTLRLSSCDTSRSKRKWANLPSCRNTNPAAATKKKPAN